MRIIFVRHGNPNYDLDCLTELGHIQAEAASERLAKEGIEKIFSSSCGRALETAEYTAKKFGLDVIPCDFIREIDWRSKDGTPILENGSPWYYAEEYLVNGKCLTDPDWQGGELFSKGNVPESFEKVSVGLDCWLEELGFKREGYFYRITEQKHNTVAMFCHAGAFACSFSHLFNLPFPFVLLSIPFDQTGVLEVELAGKPGELIAPKLYRANCTKHLRDNNIKVT